MKSPVLSMGSRLPTCAGFYYEATASRILYISRLIPWHTLALGC